jgi:hypothetical protein
VLSDITMKMAVSCALPSLRTWNTLNALPVNQLHSTRGCMATVKRRNFSNGVEVRSQNDVESMMAPLVSTSVDVSAPVAETFLEQVRVPRSA